MAGELVVVDTARREDVDGGAVGGALSYQRHPPPRLQALLDGAALADELGGGEVLHAGRWFVVVAA